MFTDDTLIYVTGESSAELESKMNIVFKIVKKWMNVNKLKMNAGKTKYMIVRSIRKELKGDIALFEWNGDRAARDNEIFRYNDQ